MSKPNEKISGTNFIIIDDLTAKTCNIKELGKFYNELIKMNFKKNIKVNK